MFFGNKIQEIRFGTEGQFMEAWDEISKNLNIEIKEDDLMVDTILKVLVELSKK